MAVFVLDKNHNPLMPCSEKRARLLLNRKRARIHRMYPLTIRVVDRTVQESFLQPVRCKIDPGSKTTGIAIVREKEDHQTVLFLLALTHRGASIRDGLKSRSGIRKRRRANLQYRSKRFSNRTKKPGWLPPSLLHRVENIQTWVSRLRKYTPITAITCERVRFDTQKLIHPEIQGIEYSRGTLFGCEIREYLLEKWGRQCAYCDAQNTPLEIDHIVPQSCGGSNRIDNLTLACRSCNLKKSNLSVEIFSPKRAKMIRSKPALCDSAAVNSTRTALWQALLELQLPCEAGTGGQTKYNRERFGIAKTHARDAACTGTIYRLSNWQIPTQQIASTGKGSYKRTRSDRFGFPRGYTEVSSRIGFWAGSKRRKSIKKKGAVLNQYAPLFFNRFSAAFNPAKKPILELTSVYLLRQKKVNGFQTGDQIIATVPSGKKQGIYKGRVAIRASGFFNVQTDQSVIQGISSKYCRLIQPADGYHYLRLTPVCKTQNTCTLNRQTEEQRFLPALKGQVSALSTG